ncbi:MAG TPA: hypothetical protein DCO82_04530 [Alphaproteobacteria bacterium]|jgi:DUF971 family protein|nr:hypothetical protein [Alphaproteobacteria bacterium]
MSNATPWPVEVKLKQAENTLEISFEDGSHCQFSAEFLRVHSPSAEVKGHGPGQEVTVAGKRGVAITRLDPVGNYALRIHFDDGHDTGLYTWAYFHQLGQRREELWSDYLRRLSLQGLSRGPDRE